MVFLDPGGEVLAIEGNGFPQARDLVLQGRNRCLKQGLQERWVNGLKRVAQPPRTGKAQRRIKAGEGRRITGEGKAPFDHQQRMRKQQAAQVAGGDQSLADAHQKSFEGGRFRVCWSPSSALWVLPLLDDGPIEHREEGTVFGDEWIMIEEGADRRLVKVMRNR